MVAQQREGLLQGHTRHCVRPHMSEKVMTIKGTPPPESAQTTTPAGTPTGGIPIKGVALPAEHGGWGFLIEPLLLGLLAVPTPAGAALALAVCGVFLLHQPLKVALKDRRKGKRYLRTRWAERFALFYGGVTLAGGLLALGLAGGTFLPALLPSLLLALPLAGVQLGYELRNRGRDLLPETAGALALGAAVIALALLAGWTLAAALVLWALLAVRSSTSILYVRARLRLEKGKPAHIPPTLAAHGGGLLALGLLVGARLAPGLALAGGVLLAGRAAYGLSRWRRPAPAKVIGIQEMFYGIAYAVLCALGYW